MVTGNRMSALYTATHHKPSRMDANDSDILLYRLLKQELR